MKLYIQREEQKNIGVHEVSKSYFFGQGLKDYIAGLPMADFGDKKSGLLKAQTAYELGRLLGAHLQYKKIPAPTKYFEKPAGAKYLQTTTWIQKLAIGAHKSEMSPFC